MRLIFILAFGALSLLALAHCGNDPSVFSLDGGTPIDATADASWDTTD